MENVRGKEKQTEKHIVKHPNCLIIDGIIEGIRQKNMYVSYIAKGYVSKELVAEFRS